MRREASLLQNSLSEVQLKNVLSRLSVPEARRCLSPRRQRPKSAPAGGYRPNWKLAKAAGEKSDAFAMRYGWQTKLPANDPSFLEMQRKEGGEPRPSTDDGARPGE